MSEIKEQRGRIWYLKSGAPGLDLNTLPRCKAIAPSTGKRCGNPAMKDKDVCCVHAGLYKPGPPKGNQHALKHGFYTAKAIAERKRAKEFLKEAEELLTGFAQGV